MAKEDKVIVEFFAPWCPACVTFLPELEKLKKERPDVPIYKVVLISLFNLHYKGNHVQVNTDENPDLKAMYNVDTYPRVLYFDGNKMNPQKYEKSWGLKFEPLKNWLKKLLY